MSYLNPTGPYWRQFEIPKRWDDQSIRVHFEGVDTAFHAYVNGKEVGYSLGGYPAEFDFAQYLSSGENHTLGARV